MLGPVRYQPRVVEHRFDFQFPGEILGHCFFSGLAHFLAAAKRGDAVRLLADDRSATLAVINRTIVGHGGTSFGGFSSCGWQQFRSCTGTRH